MQDFILQSSETSVTASLGAFTELPNRLLLSWKSVFLLISQLLENMAGHCFWQN